MVLNVAESEMNVHATKDLPPSVCKHCGTPVNRVGDIFCCQGCAFVHASIHSLGLSSFYIFRDQQPELKGEQAQELKSYAYLNDPAVCEEITEKLPNGLLRVSLYLPTIHCAACVWILEKLPSVVSAIAESRVSFSSGKIEVIIDPSSLQLDELATLLHSIGYPPVPAIEETIVEEDQRERRRMLMRIGVSAVCALNTMMLADSLFQSFFTGMEDHFRLLFTWASALIALPAVTWAAIPFYRAGIASLLIGRAHMDLPISLAIVVSYLTDISTIVQGGSHVYFDSITSLIFLLLCARYLQHQSLARSRATTATVWDLFPSMVTVSTREGLQQRYLRDLHDGEVIVVRPEERVPCDGTVIDGSSSVNNSFLTGESIPQAVFPGAPILGGSINIDGPLKIVVEKIGKATRLGRILESLRRFQSKITEVEMRANTLSGYFTVAVLAVAIVTFCYWYSTIPERALAVTVSLLVVTCPCALGLAIPSATAVALYQAQRCGLYIRDARALHALARARHYFFDKTGTLTTGTLTVSDAVVQLEHLPIIKALASSGSRHPVSIALDMYCRQIGPAKLDAVEYLPGLGVAGSHAGESWSIGSCRWMKSRGIFIAEELTAHIDSWTSQGMMVSLFESSGVCLGIFALSDRIRPFALELVSELSKVVDIAILSGDSKATVAHTAKTLKIPLSNAMGELQPEEKASVVQNAGSSNVFIGDGLNDALSLRAAAVGIAFRGGIEATLDVADIYVSQGDLHGVRNLYYGAKKLRSVITRNLILSIVYNICAAALAITGHVTPLTAAILMPISSFAVIVSSVTASYFNGNGRLWR